jgi:hypothetical protein
MEEASLFGALVPVLTCRQIAPYYEPRRKLSECFMGIPFKTVTNRCNQLVCSIFILVYPSYSVHVRLGYVA